MLDEARFVRTQCGRRSRKLGLGKLLKLQVTASSTTMRPEAIRPSPIRTSLQDGLEGMVSKHRERTYRARRSPHWIKVKNPKSSSMARAKDGPW